MVEEMKEKGYAYLSEGALVVDVKEETDSGLRFFNSVIISPIGSPQSPK